jgi:hypothetical protein
LFSGYTEEAYNALRAQLDSSTELIELQGEEIKVLQEELAKLLKSHNEWVNIYVKTEADHAALRKRLEDASEIILHPDGTFYGWIDFHHRYIAKKPTKPRTARLVVEE